jgi:hypothetical protein
MIPVTAVLLAWIFIEVLRVPERLKLRKPFSCMMCLSFWLALVLCFVPYFITEILFYTTTAAALGAWIENKIS